MISLPRIGKIWQKLLKKDSIDAMKDKIENAAYAIVCRMIDCNLVESEPEGLDWEHEIQQILEKYFE